MSGLDWYPRYAKKALDGMRHLTLEQRGAYGTLLDLIYERGGPVPDDDGLLAGYMGVSARKWRSIREALIEDGRIIMRGYGKTATLSDERAEEEIAKQNVRRKTNTDNGAIGGRKTSESRKKSQEDNGVDMATAEADAQGPLKLRQETNSKNPPTPQKGVSVSDEDVKAVWAITPPASRKRSSQKDVHRSLLAAAKRGKDPGDVRIGLVAYFASAEAQRDDSAYVKGAHRMIENDRWEGFCDGSAPIAVRSDGWWRIAVKRCRDEDVWGANLGPRPGEPGCCAPAHILAEAGFPIVLASVA